MAEIKDGRCEHNEHWLLDNDWHCSQDDFKDQYVNSCIARIDDIC